MKLMLCYKGINKQMLNDGDSYAEIVKFVHENFFLKMSKWAMQYIDSDGDSISIDSQTDIDTMIEISDKNQIKIYVKDVSQQEPSTDVSHVNISLDAESSVIQSSSKIQSVKQEKVPQEKQKLEEPQKQVNDYNIRPKREAQKRQPVQFPNFGKPFWVQMQEKYAKFIDERIQSLIPLIARKVEENIKNPQRSQHNSQKNESLAKTKHNVKCNLCEIQPIVGIRYKCSKCPFNLCQKCQDSNQHMHNLIKMKHQESEQQNQSYNPFRPNFPCPPMPFGPLMSAPLGMLSPPMMGPIMPPATGVAQRGLGVPLSSNPFKKQEKPSSRPVADFIIPEKQEQKQKQCDERLKITRKCFKMSQLFGGEPLTFEQFVTKNANLKFDELSQLYITMNENVKISNECSEKTADKAKKLGFYFKQSAQIFAEVTRKNPACNLMQLIKIVKDEKVIEKAKQSKPAKQIKQMDTEERLLENPYAYTNLPELKPVDEPKPEVKPVTVKKPLLSITKRNEFVITMKEYFGDEKVMDYIKFFNDNYEMSVEDLISMYIEKEHASK